jgi:multiple antibiotic resistance protein
MSPDLSYAFTIFLLTLGPIKTIPGFAMISADLDKSATRTLAVRGILLGTLIVFATALIFSDIMTSWRVSRPAMQIAGGLILFIAASNNITAGLGVSKTAENAPPVPKALDTEAKGRALSPLAVPTIVTPVGIAAILLFTDIAKDDPPLRAGIYALLAFIMVVNFAGMWFAKPIVRTVGIPAFGLLGWIFSVLQAGLAVQAVVGALRMMKVISPVLIAGQFIYAEVLCS